MDGERVRSWFAFGKFPESLAASALFFGEEDAVVVEGENNVGGELGDGGFGFFSREKFWGVRLAEIRNGAAPAVGLAAFAVGLPEFHEGGVVKALRGVLCELSGGGFEPDFSRVRIDFSRVVEEASEDAGDVAIDYGGGEVKGEGAQGVGGVGADARQREKLGHFLREMFASREGAGGIAQEAGAAVVAKALPGT